VLSAFGRSEYREFEDVAESAADAIDDYMACGIDYAMNLINKK
jgi:peptidyl-tRNA hydrolase